MVRMKRTTEYGLMALRYMSRKRLGGQPEVTSAREVADKFGLPFEITAKALLKLKNTGLIVAEHGAKGGYTLTQPLEQVTFGRFLELMEGEQCVVDCAPLEDKHRHSGECEYFERCEIKGLMSNLNRKLQRFLSTISLADLAESPGERIQLSKFNTVAVARAT